MSKEQWIAKHVGLQDDYASGEINLNEFQNEMKGLGFDQYEIDAEVKELDQDRNSI